jgi:uncharacterized protein (DUF433 family)
MFCRCALLNFAFCKEIGAFFKGQIEFILRICMYPEVTPGHGLKPNKMENLLTRITLNPDINHGKPGIRNTRYMVEAILEYLAGGDAVEDILAEFPDLEREDILACLAYASASMKFKDIEVPAA